MILRDFKDLKTAIIAIPQKEKDKLLLRLIAKDKVLTEHLHFKLLENSEDLNERHEVLRKEIENAVEILNADHRLSAKEVLLTMRKMNGKINHHYKVTKAISSEVELRVNLLNLIPLSLTEGLFFPWNSNDEKLVIYFLRTAKSAFSKYQKMHEDLQFDIKSYFNALLMKISKIKPAALVLESGLPKEL